MTDNERRRLWRRYHTEHSRIAQEWGEDRGYCCPPPSPQPPALLPSRQEATEVQPPPTKSLVDQLDDLDQAKKQGKISKAEYKKLREKVLNGGGPTPSVLPAASTSKSPAPQPDSYIDEIKSKGSTSAKVRAAADLCNQGKITKEEQTKLQAAILRGEM